MNRFISWIARKIVVTTAFRAAVENAVSDAIDDQDWSSLVEDNMPHGISDLESRVDDLESSLDEKLSEDGVDERIDEKLEDVIERLDKLESSDKDDDGDDDEDDVTEASAKLQACDALQACIEALQKAKTSIANS